MDENLLYSTSISAESQMRARDSRMRLNLTFERISIIS